MLFEQKLIKKADWETEKNHKNAEFEAEMMSIRSTP
jgi:hypothetical protein